MYYTFITINKLDTTKCYVGSSLYPKESGYKGSGKYIRAALSKYHRKNFERIDLGQTEYLDEAYYWEGFYIKTLKTLVKDGGYNISPKGGHRVPNSHSPETIEKIRLGNKGKLLGDKHPLYGTHMSEESKEKSRKSNLGKKRSPEVRMNISEGHKGLHYIRTKPVWNKGLTKETDERVKKYSHKKNQN